jgi:diguanylate cyclase (GGDEF)-like protein
MLTYPLAVVVARWIAIGWLLTLPPNPASPHQLRVALLAYGVITTLFAANFWYRSRATGPRDEVHPLVVPSLIVIDVAYAALIIKLYGVTLLMLLPALDAAMLAAPVGVAVLASVDLLLLDIALNYHYGPPSVIALQIAGMTFGPYVAVLFGLHGRYRAERQVRAIDQVLNAGTELGSQMSLADVLRQLRNLLGQFRRVVPWDTCVIYVVQYDDNAEEEMLVAAEITGDDVAAYRGKIAFGTGVVGYAAAKQRPALIADLHKDERQPDADMRPNARGSLVVPVVADGQAVGCVQLISAEPNVYTTDQLEHVSRLISLASVGVRNAVIHSRTRLMADTDSLTGLLSPRAYHERLESEFRKAQAARKSLSLLIIDLDYFKQVNDGHGHQAGDELLRRVGALLRQQARRNDICCRYGGDEFIIVMPETIKSEAAVVADRIRRSVEDITFASGTSHVRITVSIGAASYPQDVTDKQALIKAADDALYAAKEDGRNALRVFAPPVAR